ncbi:lantibiotic dehydratase [Streptomyces sp. B1866]|uniref:lantibiotic dehydratase n=1 Tax=Streptomyces sp. B1866 TaxID=3075431 RepID=UPI00288F9A59|nr:lantibiotic dehydratase [Streptomyces sp. B1866]MDT3396324.1 lantibiotic dehydratase [Streptomyces sp. B1866]
MRVAAYPSGFEVPAWPEVVGGSDTDVEEWRRWLVRVWAQDAVAEAVEVASPVLARRIREICDGRSQQTRQVRRAAGALVRYLLRMRHRATPFGLFAGVAPLRFGSELAVRWGQEHRAHARVDAVWLAGVVARLERCPELLRRLPVVADSTCLVRGGKLVVPFQQAPYAGPGGPAEVSTRHTKAVETAVKAAQSPVPVADLAGKLAADYPGTPVEAVERLLTALVARGVLLTSLRPPMTVTDALGHVVGELAAADAESVEEVAPLARRLVEIHQSLLRHNRAAPGVRRSVRAAIAGRMAEVSPAVEQPLVVDLRLGCSVTLPQAVAREAEKAVTALARLAPSRTGSAAWRDYHARFLERYGIGAAVPVRELVDADTGLGFPAGYRSSLLEQPRPPLTARDERLLALAQQAALDGTGELVLDDRALADLAVDDGAGGGQVQAHTQLSFRIQAPTPAVLERGAFDLVLAGVSAAAGTSAGRFLDLLDAPDRDRMAAAYAGLPTLEDGALRAQVSSPPLRVRTENVARVPAVLPYVISLAEHGAAGRALPLDDLAVCGDATRLYLTSLSLGRSVEPAVLNAVEPTNFTHPLARFLCEIPRARAAALAPFSWGAARRLPFLPRVRYGRTILAPARWRATRADLAPADSPWEQWERTMTAWARRYRLPDAVYLGDNDQRLRLDLDEPVHLRLIRDRLERTGHATLTEAPEPSAYGWLDGRPHEITLALASAAQPAPARRRTGAPTVVGREHGRLPGASEWAFVKLYGHPARQADLLTTCLPDLWETWDHPPEWWYVRYRDPEPHLRLRLRLPHPDAWGECLRQVGTWAADLRQRGLVGRVQWDTYYPETGRYGTGAAMAAAETVFAADSEAAVAQLTLSTSGDLPPQAVTAASLADLAVSFTGSTRAGLRWLIDHTTTRSGPAPARDLHATVRRLSEPHGNRAFLRSVAGGEEVAEAWARRRAALAAYRGRLADTGGPDPDAVLASLLHMHHIRAAGIDEDCERTCRRLARSAALSWTARGEGAER